MRATTPSTVTRPATISSSQTRRDPMPASASTFWSRTPSYSSTGGAPLTRARSLGDVDGVRAGSRFALAGRGLRGVLDPEVQPPLERLHHVGLGHEAGQRRQVLKRIEPDLLEEPRRGAVEDGLARTGVVADLGDVAALDERGDGRLDVHPADGRQLCTRHRLLVGDD